MIQNEIEDRLSEALLEERFGEGDKVKVDVQNDEIVLTSLRSRRWRKRTIRI